MKRFVFVGAMSQLIVAVLLHIDGAPILTSIHYALIGIAFLLVWRGLEDAK